MSVVYSLPRGTYFRPCAGIFEAIYNSPTLGVYDFNVDGNTSVELLPLSNSNIYFLAYLSFSATIDPSAYLENIETIPSLNLKTKLAGGQLYGQGLPLVTYLQQSEIAIFFWTEQQNDVLISDFRGVLGQNSSLTGVPTITAQVSLGIHEITDADFIAKIKGMAPKLGDNSKANFLSVPAAFKERI